MKSKKLVEPLLPGRYGRMDARDLDREVAKFDQEFSAEAAKPLTQDERRRDRKAKRKRGRPQLGGGAKRVLISVETSLLRRSDAYAQKHGLTRSALIARGLETLLGENTAPRTTSTPGSPSRRNRTAPTAAPQPRSSSAATGNTR